jgi:hypothetical protein
MELNRALARAFASVLVSIDMSDDDDIDPDIATKIFEQLPMMFDGVSKEDRMILAAIMIEWSELEDIPERRQAMADLPENLGLLDED